MSSFQSSSSWKPLGETQRNVHLVIGSFQSSWLQTDGYTHISLLFFSEERKYKCHLCPYAAKCRANLNQHLTVHSVKLVSTGTEDIVSAVTAEGSDGKKHPYYYRWAPTRGLVCLLRTCDRATLLVLQGWSHDWSICLARVCLRLSSEPQLAASCCLTWLAIGKGSGLCCGVGFLNGFVRQLGS